MNIGQKIKTLRENNNISIEELAKKNKWECRKSSEVRK